MAIRIEITTTVPDSRAGIKKKKLHEIGFRNITDIAIADVYTVDKKFSKDNIVKIGNALINPVTQQFKVKGQRKRRRGEEKFTFAIEIGFLPGVTDNVAHTTKEIIEDLLKLKFKNNEGVYTSQIIFLTGKISKEEVERIASTLFNPVIQRAQVKNIQQYKKDHGMDVVIPKVKLVGSRKVSEVSLSVSEDVLQRIGKLGIENPDGTTRGPLALDISFMKAIKEYFEKKKRNPRDIELESIAQTWSEHCKHTIFANPLDDIQDGIFNHYIRRETEKVRKQLGKDDFCVSVFTDNSGAIEFDDTYLVTHKVETHNSPSALDPFGGSITGIVGVNRDAMGFGLGAKPVANMYGFCLADPRKDIPLYKGKDFTQKMLSSKRIMEGVIEGVNAGGNQSGIPTLQGFVYFDERYRGKPLVFVGTVGLIPKKIQDPFDKLRASKKSWSKKANPGDYIVMVGGRVGKDGIHGATFSSVALDSGSPATAVQIGDPITQKKMSDVLIKEARDQLLYTSITDNGAGGLSCSVAEMAEESGGCVVDLEKVPLKYPGLAPWEIWISESQERMTLAVPKRKWKKLFTLLKNRGVEATVIGQFTDSGKCIVQYYKKIIMDIDMDFLHNGMPIRQQVSKKIESVVEQMNIKEPKNLTKILLGMLSQPNLTSYSFISSQYDSLVQAGSVIGPLQGRGRVNGESSVFRPILSSPRGIVLSHGLYPAYAETHPYTMAAASIDMAVRNAVAAGANPKKIALLDNFCWCSSTDSKRLYQLKEAARACYEIGKAFGMPLISGKDSMFNDFSGYDKKNNQITISILPTLLISSISVIDDITKAVSLDLKMPGDLVYLLGETNSEVGKSEYAAFMQTQSGKVARVDALKNKKLYSALFSAIDNRLVASSIGIGKGGLAVALSKMAIGGKLGLQINVAKLQGRVYRNDCSLFSESHGRIVVAIAPENKDAFELAMKGNAYAQIGVVTKDEKVIIKGLKEKVIVKTNVKQLEDAYKKTFRGW